MNHLIAPTEAEAVRALQDAQGEPILFETDVVSEDPGMCPEAPGCSVVVETPEPEVGFSGGRYCETHNTDLTAIIEESF